MKRLILAALLACAPMAVATAPAHAAACGPDDTPIVVEYGDLDHGDQVVCAQDVVGKTGLQALTAAGLDYDETSADAPLVCRIEHLPLKQDEKCGTKLSGKGYWAFLVAQEGKDWGYATTGLGEHKIAKGEYVALVYHLMSEGENVTAKTPADAATREKATVPAAEKSSTKQDDDSSFPVGTVVGIVVVVLVLGAAFVVVRRRSAA